MKRSFLAGFVCVLLALLACVGCTRQAAPAAPPAEAGDTAAAEAAAPAEEDEPAPDTPAEAPAAEAKLSEIFDAVHGRVFPGTAGSSLSAAACAAELADLFFEGTVSPDAADAAVQDYCASLAPEDAELFELQLDAVVSAFSNLTAENGAGLLADCGYKAAHYPWDSEGVRDCFTALLGSD